MDETQMNDIVDAVVRQLIAAGAVSGVQPVATPAVSNQPVANLNSNTGTLPQTKQQKEVKTASTFSDTDLSIDLPDPANEFMRYKPRITHPKDPAALQEIINSTPARIGVGRAGPRYRTDSLLLFQADHAITQDALYRDVDQKLLDDFGLFTVQSNITGGKDEFLLRPDLGRKLNEEARNIISAKCLKNPNVQLVVGDGLSAAAIETNFRQIFPVIKQGIQAAGLTFGTPFYIRYCRVGVMNDIGEAIRPDVLILLIGERPGLGRAESMSAYMGYKPKYGESDADRDVICNIFENGGTNPLEAGAFVVQIAQKMRKYQTSGVKLKLATA
jgi:ethanolamine ammonia-lyase small subunit